MKRTSAIILSAGKGTRFGGNMPKQYLLLDGKPMLYYALKAFELSRVNEVILVAGEDELSFVHDEIVEKYGFSKVTKVIAGGKEGYNSVMNGLEALKESNPEVVLIHDGARPLIGIDVINEIIEETFEHEAVIAAMPVKDTIKLSDDDGFIKATTERKNTWMAQTPQAFKYQLILEAYRKTVGADSYQKKEETAERALIPESIRLFCDEKNESAEDKKKRESLKNITDDAMVFSTVFPEKKVKLIKAGYSNIKITTNEDLKTAEAMMR